MIGFFATRSKQFLYLQSESKTELDVRESYKNMREHKENEGWISIRWISRKANIKFAILNINKLN